MSVKRRLAAAGLPVAGVTVFAALALTGQPASAAVDTVVARQGIAAGLAATCDPAQRTKCGYGSSDVADTAIDDDADTSADDTGTDDTTADDTAADDTSDDSDATGSGPDDADDAGAGATAGSVDDTRGNDGYGGGPDDVPGGAGPETTPPGGAGPDAVPNGGGGTLPLTGAPMAALTTVGGLLTAAGAALCFGVWYNARRRRRA